MRRQSPAKPEETSEREGELYLAPTPRRAHDDIETPGLGVWQHLHGQSLDAGGDDVEGAIRGVVRARQVNEHEPRDTGVVERLRELGRLFIREVPERSRDSTLEVRRVGPGLEKTRAIVRFEEHEITLGDEGAQLSRDMPNVSNDDEA
jgi:hypothetical protein